ncbi:MAG TPA: hypothetical protein VGD03_10300 [Frankiaceae bacterium]
MKGSDATERLVLLAAQDRSRWDRAAVAEGPGAGLAAVEALVGEPHVAGIRTCRQRRPTCCGAAARAASP